MPPPAAQDSPAEESRAALPTLRAFEVEENDAVVNVTPNLQMDPHGGFLVSDASESQIRRYSPDGELLWFAGRRGQGPGEFGSVTGVARLPSGEIVATDRNGRLTFFAADGGRVLRTAETKLTKVQDFEIVDDSTLLIAGVGRGGTDGPRLHIWNIRRNASTREFFAPFARQKNRTAATVADYVMTSLRGDTIAATFASSDTVYLFMLDGRDVGRVMLNSEHFRPTPEAEANRRITDPLERAQWLSAFDFVADVHWLPNGELLIAYQSIEGRQAMRRTWHLLGQDRAGKRRFEYRSVSSFRLGVHPSNGTVFFVPRTADAPNRWAVARFPE